MSRAFLVIAAVLCVVAGVFAQDQQRTLRNPNTPGGVKLHSKVNWYQPTMMGIARQTALESNKMMIVLTLKSWESYSHQLANALYDSKEFRQLSHHFVMCYLGDFEVSRHVSADDLAYLHPADANYYPRALFFNPDGTRAPIVSSNEKHPYFYHDAAELIANMKAATAHHAAAQMKDVNERIAALQGADASKAGRKKTVHDEVADVTREMKAELASIEAEEQRAAVGEKSRDEVKREEREETARAIQFMKQRRMKEALMHKLRHAANKNWEEHKELYEL